MPQEKLAGNLYELPTEAQWEFACRARTTPPFHFGRALNGVQANAVGNYPYGTSEKGPSLNRTTTVGSYASNAWGLFDMHGNVSEWCADWYDKEYYSNAPSDDPKGPAAGASRVIRGGGWFLNALRCRSARRSHLGPAYRNDYYGFRLVRVW